ncbi:MAG: 4-hydroxybenzoyl-CoA thioesterase [Prevotella sp.]|nr:4-hydroxybenzoyl-CoA thioesterase [Prevotella sp.]
MKTFDFETAIDSLNCAITIDEMVLRKGAVRSVYAHGSHVYIKWDFAGRSYTAESEEELSTEVIDPRCEVDEWKRNKLYDLKFK